MWAQEEGHLFHNRLTHSLKVAQVGRRIAEKLLAENGTDAFDALGGLDASAVEAAGLAHDLGHPPFGHIAEDELHRLLKAAGCEEGFEGNAQTFRIVTRLAVISPAFEGMNLTRATLAAILKYPWTSDDKRRKAGAYGSEATDFEFARDGLGLPHEDQTIEAAIMDWSDDIAYAVHDVEDFYRAGLIPLSRLANLDRRDLEPLFALAKEKWEMKRGPVPTDDELVEAAGITLTLSPENEAFRGTRGEQAALYQYSSGLIGRFVRGTSFGGQLQIDRPVAVEVGL